MATAIQKSGSKGRAEAQAQHDRILEVGPRLFRDWHAFYRDVIDFQEVTVNGTPKWRLCGYENWQQFEQKVCKQMQQSRATFYACVKTVRALPPATIMKLGKTKSHMAARLKKAGKLTPAIQEKLEREDVEDAKATTRKALGQKQEGRIRLVLAPLESQYDAFVAQIKRIQKVMDTERMEDALDLLVGHVATMSDHEIKMEFKPEE